MSLFILSTLAAFFIKGLCGFANTHLRRGHHPHRAGYAARAGQAAKREKMAGRADHGGQAHAVHARQPLCRNCGQQKNRRPANQEAGAPAAGRLRRNADCAESIGLLRREGFF